jgi:hypothetical protein
MLPVDISRKAKKRGERVVLAFLLVSRLAERFTLFVVVIAFFDAVPKAVQRTGLVGVSTVDINLWMVALKAETKIYVAAKAVGNLVQTVFVKLTVYLWVRVLKHMLLALEHTQN